jgi:hypothetical protein
MSYTWIKYKTQISFYSLPRKKKLLIVIAKLYKIMVIQMLRHGCENLTLLKQKGRRIEPARMKLLRTTAGYT